MTTEELLRLGMEKRLEQIPQEKRGATQLLRDLKNEEKDLKSRLVESIDNSTIADFKEHLKPTKRRRKRNRKSQSDPTKTATAVPGLAQPPKPKRRHTISAAGRRAISKAQKKRWARVRRFRKAIASV